MSAELIAKGWLVMLCAPGIVPAAIFYIRHCNQTPRGQNRFPLGLYVVALLTCAVVAFWVGVGWGVNYACSRPFWGNLCGLPGLIVVGPISSIITVSMASWLMTSFPLQMKRVALMGVIIPLVAIGFYYRDNFRSFFFSDVMQQNLLYGYRLQSGNLEDLHRYAPVMEAQMRELPVLEDVRLDSQLKSDQAIVGVDPRKPTVPIIEQLPTMTIRFRLAPKVTFTDAIAQIHEMEIRLALPATIRTSLGQQR
jgi:hypothetical protein